ncbi:hypothetical protein [Nitratireductor pacificus]|uniref:Uncharacterized protein n=1 Tax=Nitratireductor pacificus pht-3B TaxID=391937 RepID=K2MYK9_9HYPH|nr:hypothetical protein [Nitratireductor pacificus]EKF17053.1 hypothetical protein NA2_19823 [Nitratireductor pacificus pht-3B]
MSDQQNGPASPMVLAVESAALNEFYRKRTLGLSAALEQARMEVDALNAEVERLTKINGKLQDVAAKEAGHGG